MPGKNSRHHSVVRRCQKCNRKINGRNIICNNACICKSCHIYSEDRSKCPICRRFVIFMRLRPNSAQDIESKDNPCIICNIRNTNTKILDCGHSISCATCALRLLREICPKCPICRTIIYHGVINVSV